MAEDDLLNRWRAAETAQCRRDGAGPGWDFAALAEVMTDDPVPGDLDAEYREALSTAEHVLEMGTGGGEHLLRHAGLLPTGTIATEGWAPNVPVARATLDAPACRSSSSARRTTIRMPGRCRSPIAGSISCRTGTRSLHRTKSPACSCHAVRC